MQLIRQRLAPIRCFLLDMDGTFYLGERLLDGSLAFLDRLRSTGRSALFLTNNSSKSAQAYVDKLRRMGVEEPFLNVLTSGQAAARYCLRAFAGQRAFVLGNPSLKAELRAMGFFIGALVLSSTWRTIRPTMCSWDTTQPSITPK